MITGKINQLAALSLFGKPKPQKAKIEELTMELKIVSNWDKVKIDTFIRSIYEESVTLPFDMYQFMSIEIEFEKRAMACLSDFNEAYIQDSVLKDYQFFIPPINSGYDVYENFVNPLKTDATLVIQNTLKTIILYRKNRN